MIEIFVQSFLFCSPFVEIILSIALTVPLNKFHLHSSPSYLCFSLAYCQDWSLKCLLVSYNLLHFGYLSYIYILHRQSFCCVIVSRRILKKIKKDRYDKSITLWIPITEFIKYSVGSLTSRSVFNIISNFQGNSYEILPNSLKKLIIS